MPRQAADPSFIALRERYGTDTIAFVAELHKKNAERKAMHEMLNAYNIPTLTPAGRGLCLLARLAIALERTVSHGSEQQQGAS